MKIAPLKFVVKPQKWVPTPYMRRAVKFLCENPGAGLLLDPGLRKTSITLAAFSILLKAGVARKALIIAPLRVCYQVWRQEGEKWVNFNHLKFSLLHGDKKSVALGVDADIYIINPAGLPWLFQDPANFKLFKKLKIDTLIIDESTQFKNTQTTRFKLLKTVLSKFQRRWLLTGTPAPNGLLDLFGQMFIIDGGDALGKFITHYRLQYFDIDPVNEYGYEIKEGAEELIYKRVKPFTLRLDAKDYIQLPEMIVEPIWVELDRAARKIYNDMEHKLIAQLEGGDIVTSLNAGVASKKCEQIANGGLYIENIELDEYGDPINRSKRVWNDIHLAKIDALMELRESISGQQLMIAYDFYHDLSRLRAALGKDTPYIGSGVSPAKGMMIEQLWNKGKIRDLLGHPQSMGHGLNLQYGGNHIAWHSPTWNLELWDQYNRRILRSGSPHKHVFVYPILARDTVDEAKWAALERKDKVQRSLLDALKAYVATRKRK